MYDMEYLTISEMAQTLGVKEGTVRGRLRLAKCAPVKTNVSLYTQDDFEVIKAVKPKGWPKQPKGGWPKKKEAD
jgi:hypothetical protein